jgi:hypothetical protein
MFPDLITPRSFPDLLAQVDYDPYEVMPGELPPAPRVFATAGQFDRARARVKAGVKLDVYCHEQLLKNITLDKPLPVVNLNHDGPPDWGGPLVPILEAAVNHAFVWQLTGEAAHRERALDALRIASKICLQTKWNGNEHHESSAAARAYDLLASEPFDEADDKLFRDALYALISAMDTAEHRHCNNHNAMQMAGRLALAAALGDRQQIHNVFYGSQTPKGWRYGVIHLMRHDFLADGMHWEGVTGYHMLVLGLVFECFTIMEHLGVDLWHRQWPSLMQTDSWDEHRGWGPKGNRSLQAAVDALIYQSFTNGDQSLLHDQVLGNLTGTGAWWPIFQKAWDVYKDPRYAWVVTRTNGNRPVDGDGVPSWYHAGASLTQFVRFETREFPAGTAPWKEDRKLGIVGRHERGCSLFPQHGSAVLRSDLTRGDAIGAYFYWGPHWNGHRGPAALHLDIHALGGRSTTAPHLTKGGYADPMHLTWFRTTVAHNTVVIDKRSMLPFDFETDSLWECDIWRDTISDGVLESFQTGDAFHAVRASNYNVYPHVTLDRTVVVTGQYVLDVYRVTADEPRLLDWTMHCHGQFPALDGQAVDLGDERGYRHMTDGVEHPQRGGWVDLAYTYCDRPARAQVWLDGAKDARLILANDPPVDSRRPIGDTEKPQPRTCVMVRSRSKAALFVSLWSFGGTNPPRCTAVEGAGDADVSVAVQVDGGTQRWSLPARGDVSLR